MRRLLLVLSTLLTLALATGCVSMQQLDFKGATVAEALRDKHVLKIGDQLELSTVDGRQLKGKVASFSETTLTVNDERGEAFPILLNEVATLRTEQFDLAQTAGGVLLTYTAINVIGALILMVALGGVVAF